MEHCLNLTVKEVDDKLEFSVSDNGKGFDAVMVRRGNGLENMQKRADEIGAKLVLQSKENGGAIGFDAMQNHLMGYRLAKDIISHLL